VGGEGEEFAADELFLEVAGGVVERG